MAMAASSIVSSSAPAAAGSGPSRRAWEEDDALGVARDVVERLDHARLAPPGSTPLGDGGPHALIELAAELADQQLLLFGHLDVPFGDEHLTVAALHAKEPHGVRRLSQ